ncbi:MAG: hypothetical protein Kow00127_15760 [Bacteroidales bacterium]
MFRLNFKEVLLTDSSTLRLFSEILKGAGRNPRGDDKKKGGLKVQMLIDAVRSVGRFIKSPVLKYMTGTISKAMISAYNSY